jgi:hypothetical protein
VEGGSASFGFSAWIDLLGCISWEAGYEEDKYHKYQAMSPGSSTIHSESIDNAEVNGKWVKRLNVDVKRRSRCSRSELSMSIDVVTLGPKKWMYI